MLLNSLKVLPGHLMEANYYVISDFQRRYFVLFFLFHVFNCVSCLEFVD